MIVSMSLFVEINGQTVFWYEDFDDGGGGRWTLENALGSGTNPTPAGIVGLTYGSNNPIFDNFIINDRNTPELSGGIAIGTVINSQGAFVRGRHYACAAPSNLPNPFINTGGGPNQSLHITAHSACATLLYGGTPQSDDWNCISDPDNGDVQTGTEQIAYLNQNIDATGKCNIKLTADFFLGGDADGIKSHSTILYSIDAGVTWKIVQDNLKGCSPFLAGSCNNWHRRSFIIPSDADNQPDVRIAFRWYDDGDIDNTGDYALGASFNVDNVMLSACAKPNADFISQAGSNVCKSQTVIFNSSVAVNNGVYLNCFTSITDNCTVSAYSWNISPATFVYVNGTSSTDSDPQVQFTANGVYTIEVTVSTCGGDSTVTKTNMITVADCPPTAEFVASNTIACTTPVGKLDTITFTDMSSTFAAPITAWSWTFTPATVTYVNGTSSTDQNPQVTFNAPGTYQVTLQVTSAEGVDTEIKIAFIEAISCECGGGVGGPTNLYSEDFTGGAGGFTLNSVEPGLGTTAGNENNWTVNSVYAGGLFPATPNRGGGNYLHIQSNFACGLLGECQAVFNAGNNQKSFAKTPTINTSGATGVSISFWMLNASTGTTGDAEVFYSTNGGTSWTSLVTYTNEPAWAFKTMANVAFDNQANLRFGFQFDDNPGGTGTAVDPSFSVDEVSVDAASAAALPNTWQGVTSTNWNTASNWSNASVPVSTDDVLIPSAANLVGTFMPTISAAAVARNVCNFGTITLTGNNTLTIDVDLLNEGVVTTTTTVNTGDVIFVNSASVYRGAGTMYDVDVSVTSSDLTLETDLITRSLNIATTGTVDLATLELSINKDLTKSAGTFIPTNGVINFIDACGTCVDATSNATVTLNVNQAFGNVFVNKTAGVVTGLMSNVNHTFTLPKTLTIQSGIVDVNTNTLIGTGNLTMTGGELQLAKCATVIPELTGAYSLTAGQVTFDGVCNQTTKVSSPVVNYYDVEYTGTGVKTLDNNNLLINNQLLLNLPTATGNYVNTGTDTVKMFNNNSAGVITRTGGHVVGYLSRAITSNGGTYSFYVGSDNSDLETYYEPIHVTPVNLTGTSAIIADFNDAPPNPSVVVPNIYFGLAPTTDTIQDVEDEGYWTLKTDNTVLGGTYEATVSPDINFWTFTNVWGGGRYTLLKQSAITIPWDYTAGGSRIDDSTTTNFSDFSNFALGFSKNNPLPPPLPVELLAYQGHCDDGVTLLSWITASEINAEKFIVEKSVDGIAFEYLGSVSAAGNSNETRHYNFEDNSNTAMGAYYRLSQRDFDGTLNILYTIFVECKSNTTDFEFEIYPNPTTGVLNANIFTTQKGIVDIAVYDIYGSIIYKNNANLTNKGVNMLSFNLNHLSNGIYIVNARYKESFKNIRLVITR